MHILIVNISEIVIDLTNVTIVVKQEVLYAHPIDIFTRDVSTVNF